MVLDNDQVGGAGHPFGFDHDLIAYAGFAIMVVSSRFKHRSTYILVETLGIVIVAVYWLLLVQFEAALDDLFYIVLNLSAILVLRNARLQNLYYLNYPLLLGSFPVPVRRLAGRLGRGRNGGLHRGGRSKRTC